MTTAATTVEAPEIQRPPATPAPLSRTASMVHGFAILSALITAALAFTLKDSNDKMTILGVSLSAVLALGCWSAILSVRAIRSGEASRWPLVIFACVLIEISLVCVGAFIMRYLNIQRPGFADLINNYGLPVFVPMFSIATLISAPLSWWWVRRDKSRPASRRRTLVIYALSTLFLVSLLLPYPLFFFCLEMANPRHWMESRPAWTNKFCAQCPSAIRDSADDLLASCGLTGSRLHRVMLQNRYVSRQRLETYKYNIATADAALLGLLYPVTPNSLPLAIEIANGKYLGTRSSRYVAADVLTTYASHEQLAAYLKQRPSGYSFLNELVDRLSDKNSDCLPELEALAVESTFVRDQALYAIARIAKPEQSNDLWKKFLSSSDKNLVERAACYNSTIDKGFLTGAAALANPDPAIRRLLLNNISWPDMYEHSADIHLAIEQLLKLLDDPDIVQRRGARFWISHLTLTFNDSSYPPTGVADLDNDIPASETEQDRASFDAARKTARQWLDQHK